MLEMKYHPALGEVQLTVIDAVGRRHPLDAGSGLKQYEDKMRGTFILQQQGAAFLDAIAHFFDGEDEVTVRVKATASDFEDFCQMTELYNQEECHMKIHAQLLAELPNTNKVYDRIKQYGETVKTSLGQYVGHINEFSEEQKDDDVKKITDNFIEEIQAATKKITDTIKATRNNKVNLCFSGVYSAGKSALINALLGYDILPKATDAKTAHIFRIESPPDGQPVEVSFTDDDNGYTSIRWNDAEKRLVRVAGRREGSGSAGQMILSCLEENRHASQMEQLHKLLERINDDPAVPEVKLYFPIPFDDRRVQFVLYDTPGTDSNHPQHDDIFRAALQQQTHSILIWVLHPTKNEGTGMSRILQFLRIQPDAEETDVSYIDVARSFFVVNWMDSVNKSERKKHASVVLYQREGPGQIEGGKIDLKDKKVFLISAQEGYAARAKENKVMTEDEEEVLSKCASKKSASAWYFQYDHIGESEIETQRVQQESENALRAAEKAKDEARAVYIGAGLYALEQEVKHYGEKYATAVRAAAVIRSVSAALHKLDKNAQFLQLQQERKRYDVDEKLARITDAVNTGIEEVYQRYAIKGGLPGKIIKELHLDAAFIQENLKGKATGKLNKLLKASRRFLHFFFGTAYRDEDRQVFIRELGFIINEYNQDMQYNVQRYLEKNRDDCIKETKAVLSSYGEISPEAQRYLLDITPPDIVFPVPDTKITNIFEYNRDHGFIFENVDEGNLRGQIEDLLTDFLRNLADTVRGMIEDSNNDTCSQIRKEFQKNLENYSLLVRGLQEKKEVMKALGDILEGAVGGIKKEKDKIEQEIWKEA